MALSTGFPDVYDRIFHAQHAQALTSPVFSALICLMCPFLPDSPRLLIRKGKYDEAYEVLAALEGNGATVNSPSVRTQFAIIKKVLDEEYAVSYSWWQIVRGKGPAGVLRRMLLGAWMQASNQISGINVTSYCEYPPTNAQSLRGNHGLWHDSSAQYPLLVRKARIISSEADAEVDLGGSANNIPDMTYVFINAINFSEFTARVLAAAGSMDYLFVSLPCASHLSSVEPRPGPAQFSCHGSPAVHISLQHLSFARPRPSIFPDTSLTSTTVLIHGILRYRALRSTCSYDDFRYSLFDLLDGHRNCDGTIGDGQSRLLHHGSSCCLVFLPVLRFVRYGSPWCALVVSTL